MLNVEVSSQNIHPSLEVDIEAMQSAARKIMEYILPKSFLSEPDFDKVTFDILYCDNEKIREINREYRGKNETTDVITFAIFADSEPKIVTDGQINLGEIIVSLDYSETLLLVTHGILHLLGFDHKTDEEYNVVIRLQQEALASLEGKNE
jgi:probable rRNA maturation factor